MKNIVTVMIKIEFLAKYRYMTNQNWEIKIYLISLQVIADLSNFTNFYWEKIPNGKKKGDRPTKFFLFQLSNSFVSPEIN